MLAAQITAIMLIAAGLSQVLWSGLWADLTAQFMRSRHPAGTGMLIGMLALVLGLLLILPDHPRSGPLIITTIVGWIMVVKAGVWLLLPGLALAVVPRRTRAIATLSVFWGLISMTAGGVLAASAFADTAQSVPLT